jgi:hypothetical protein
VPQGAASPHAGSGEAAIAHTTVISSAAIDHRGRAQGALRARDHRAASSADQTRAPAGTERAGIGAGDGPEAGIGAGVGAGTGAGPGTGFGAGIGAGVSDTRGLCGTATRSPLPVHGNVPAPEPHGAGSSGEPEAEAGTGAGTGAGTEPAPEAGNARGGAV